MRVFLSLMLLLGACSDADLVLGDFELEVDEGAATLAVYRSGRPVFDLQQLALGSGTVQADFSRGFTRFETAEESWAVATSLKARTVEDDVILLAHLRDADGENLAILEAWTPGTDLLALRISPFQDLEIGGGAVNRVRARVGCAEGGPFLGAGGHALDVDHQGETLTLWAGEAGDGRVEDDELPAAWDTVGTRHSTSFPTPFLLRPEVPVGVGLDTHGRVDLDLCSSDPGIYELSAWDQALAIYLIGGDDPLAVVERNVLASGGTLVPPDWAFGPWSHAVGGQDAVLARAAALREAGAPLAAIWTEDWQGAVETADGVQPASTWTVDAGLYPDPAGTAETLRAQGLAWLGEWSPFVDVDAAAWAEAEADALFVEDAAGEALTLEGPAGAPVSLLDPTDGSAEAWMQDRLEEALELGLAGWTADHGEWMPPDAALRGADPLLDHNAMPLYWQHAHASLLAEQDGLWAVRSGWSGTAAMAPVVWAGDQQTSFDPGDGYPSVVPLGLGLSTSGVTFFGHDVGGVTSVGVAPRSRELWYRWTWLGAFSPIMRSHPGEQRDAGWDVDSDEDSLAHWARAAGEHARLLPYLQGLAALAQSQGRPLLLHPALVYEGYDWARTDAWLLGEALFVAPVLEEGATGRQVELPPGEWVDWWTGQAAQDGWVDADIDAIPVYAARGSIVPLLAQAPDTFLRDADDALLDLDEADEARVIRVYGTGGSFVEADGTTYAATGTATAAGSATETLWAGTIEVNGLSLSIEGTTPRSYTVEVVP